MFYHKSFFQGNEITDLVTWSIGIYACPLIDKFSSYKKEKETDANKRINEKESNFMELSPIFYHKMIRPKWITQKYIHNKIKQHVSFDGQKTLDFGTGTGANCILCNPEDYIGIDPDVKRITFAKRVYPDYQFDIFENDELPVKDNSLDIVLIVAVLHHISPEQIKKYVKEFRRVLKETGGKIIVIEPCFFEKSYICNWFMDKNDNGAYIQNETGYLNYFQEEGFTCQVIKKYRKCFLYNELFFQASV